MRTMDGIEEVPKFSKVLSPLAAIRLRTEHVQTPVLLHVKGGGGMEFGAWSGTESRWPHRRQPGSTRESSGTC